MRRHERVANRRNVVIVVLVLDENGLPEQVAKSDAQDPGDITEDVESADVALAALDLAQPVLRPPDKAGQDRLGETAPPSVKRDALSNAQVVTRAPHDLNDRPASGWYPDSLSGSALPATDVMAPTALSQLREEAWCPCCRRQNDPNCSRSCAASRRRSTRR